MITDGYGRKIEYMRISVTDRCSLRCRYCMPCGIEKVPMSEILTYEEITEIAEACASLGINRLRLTGGEPLVRREVDQLVSMLKDIPGIVQVTMTTNGELLEEHLERLEKAGLDGVNISLDTMSPEKYSMITGGGNLDSVLEGIKTAAGSSLKTKINCVVQKGTEESDIADIVNYSISLGTDVKFIEMMPVGHGVLWTGMDTEEVKEIIGSHFGGLEPYDD